MISRERCSMKFCTGWLDKSVLPGNGLWFALKLNSCYGVISLFSLLLSVCAVAMQTNTEPAPIKISCVSWVKAFFICCIAETHCVAMVLLWLRHKHMWKTAMKNSAEKMRINGCQSPCGIGNQWSIKGAFSQQTDKIAWITSAWHFS